MNCSIQPLLAVDCLQILFGFAGFIGFIVWVIVQIAKAAPTTTRQAPPALPAGSRKPQAGTLQKEIDIFLRQVSPKGSRPGGQERATSQRASAPDARKNPPSQTGRREKESRRRQGKLGSEVATRKGPGREDLGNEVREHVTRHLDTQPLSERVQDDLANRVQQSVIEHLGSGIATTGSAAQVPSPPSIGTRPPTSDAIQAETASNNAREFRRMLRQPGQIRQAILLNEILSRPLALRKSPRAR